MSIDHDIAQFKREARDQHDRLVAALFTPLIRMPAYSPTDRVIVPPTSGAPDPVYRAGGPGTVCWVREVGGETFYYVAADGGQDTPQPYRADELQLEPPV